MEKEGHSQDLTREESVIVMEWAAQRKSKLGYGQKKCCSGTERDWPMEWHQEVTLVEMDPSAEG